MGERWYAVQVDQVRTNPVRVLVDGEAVEIEVEGLPYGGVDLTRDQLDDSTVGDVQEVRSPMPGGSTLMTSAPWSPNIMVAMGPDNIWVTSMIR